ncbi:hypothetical protein FOA52_004913 [Chlamydomonas sp. UWO 241]|nr:hypothetical protein FOA52_004913 [Chlamydomonas sp. UWO 241]
MRLSAVLRPHASHLGVLASRWVGGGVTGVLAAGNHVRTNGNSRTGVRAWAAADATTSASPSSSASATTAPPPALSGAEIREAFLSFFEGKGHTRLPSSSLVPEDSTVLLTIAGMLQFKPVFLGQEAPKVPRATTTQKCVRTNDIENVGVTARHHTFFEMLGNFSFGDYFKRDACAYAWELSTRVYGLPAERMWVSVYEDDSEALALWRDVVGVPAERIKKMGAKDNFWASGPTGPCGPCSELYYDFHPERGIESADLDDDSRFIEFYNLVFMEMNRDADGSLTPLAAKNIDTGMGLERMAQILQRVPNNYETDLIFPIVARAAELAGVDYHTADKATKAALKVIGDHTRAVVYLISDGVTPSNVGRGYIVRRLLRRVVMKGRLLGIRGGLFTPQVAEVAVALSGQCDPGVASNAQRVYQVLAQEEGAFGATLEKGQKILGEMLARAGASADRTLAGADAFLLYDTFGFPLELTQEMAEQGGIAVDTAAFTAEMSAQKRRSKDSREDVDMTAGGSYIELAGATTFTGYTQTSGSATVVALLSGGVAVSRAEAGQKVELLLDTTPFYAESGGQVTDTGSLATPCGLTTLRVSSVQKAAGGSLSVHTATVEAGCLSVGDAVSAAVDVEPRRRTTAHHTATHLLQSALKAVLGQDTCQQGSLCDAERLRFDFNLTRAMTADEVERVEGLVNSWVLNATPLSSNEMAIDAARAAGATAMFGEKYGDVVRVVDVPGVSMELCGGTHVSNTAQVGAFRVLSESGIASGVRRIEAVAGGAAVDYLRTVDGLVRQAAGSLKVKADEVPARVADLQAELRAAGKEIEALRSQLAVAKSGALISRAFDSPSKGCRVLVEELDGVDAKAMQEAAVSLQATLGDGGAVVLGTRAPDGKANFVAAFGPGAVKAGANAGKLVGAVAKVCSGGGGGKPGLAQAGGKDSAKFDEAMALARATLTEAL